MVIEKETAVPENYRGQLDRQWAALYGVLVHSSPQWSTKSSLRQAEGRRENAGGPTEVGRGGLRNGHSGNEFP